METPLYSKSDSKSTLPISRPSIMLMARAALLAYQGKPVSRTPEDKMARIEKASGMSRAGRPTF